MVADTQPCADGRERGSLPVAAYPFPRYFRRVKRTRVSRRFINNPRMKLFILLLAFIVVGAPLFGATRVKGYTRKDGTFVAPHTRSAPNRTKVDNYSTKGNINPYTGKAGTKPVTNSSTASKQVRAYSPPLRSTAPASAGVRPRSVTRATKPAPATEPATHVSTKSIGAVTAGMNKAQVIVAVGVPNIKSNTSWFYIDQGWVRFANEKVTAVEAATARSIVR